MGPLRNISLPFLKKPTWPRLKTRCERIYRKDAEKKKKEREQRGEKRGKGLELKIWAVKQRRPIAKYLPPLL